MNTILDFGIAFNVEIYGEDTSVEIMYTQVNGCDSLVVYNVQIITTVLEQASKSVINVYPNPAQGKVFVLLKLAEPMENVVLKIYNQIGQELQMISLKNVYPSGQHIIPIELNDFEAGVYLMHFRSSGFSWTERLVVKK